jgi:hypothetical protein
MTPKAHICNWYHEPTAVDPESGRLLPGVSLDGLESHGMCTGCRARFLVEELEPFARTHRKAGVEPCPAK